MNRTPKLEAFTSTMNNLRSKISDTKDKIMEQSKKIINKNPNQNAPRETTGISNVKNISNEFTEKNSFIAKLIFIIFVMIMFGLLFRLGIYILTLFFVPRKNPTVVDGMRSTLQGKEYQVNPNVKDPKPILRSINEDQGMEFSWSSWIWINSTDYPDTEPRLLFTKGETHSSTEFNNNFKRDFMMNSPGLYVYDNNTSTSKTNALSVVVSFFDKNELDSEKDNLAPYEIITVSNIPMQKWLNVIIRVQGKIIDIYINGILTKRKEFQRVIKQNYGNVRVGSSKYGADAYISLLRYFDHAIGANTIQNIIFDGPKLKMEGSEMTNTKPPYLAMRWYLDEN